MVRDRESVEREDATRFSWAPRVLAPLAFFVAATILIVIVNNSLSRDEETGSPAQNPPPAAATATATGGTATGAGPQRRRFYTIREGDTLEAIAARFGTTVDDLLTLNPGIDANALTPGQRVRIR